MKTNKKLEELKQLLPNINCGEKDVTLEQAIELLAVCTSDIEQEGTLESGRDFLCIVEELFGGMVIPSLYSYSDERWKRNEASIEKILLTVKNLVCKYGSEKQNPGRNSEDMLTLCQNMHLYLAYYYRYKGMKKEFNQELNEILIATEDNMRYVMSFDEDRALAMLNREDSVAVGDYNEHGREIWSEPLASLYYEMDSGKVFPLYEQYIDFLHNLKDEAVAKSALEEIVLPSATERLDRLYRNSLYHLEKEIAKKEEQLLKLCKKRKKIEKKLPPIQGEIDMFG